MGTMKAVWYRRTGPAREVLEFGEQPLPEPGSGQVRIRLRASGVNPADCNRRAGRGYAMEAPLVIPHSDGAGIIDAVGEGVTSRRVGERVWLYNGQRGRPLGTAAEAIAIDADLVSPLPDHVPFEAGACLGIPCMTAHLALSSFGAINGKTVFVTGGAGAVGHYAIQLAKWMGARVLTTVSGPEKARDARAAGADSIIDYRTDDVVARLREETSGHGVDHVVDVDFGGNLAILPDIVSPSGTVASYASRGNPAPTLPFYALMRKNVAIRFVLLPSAPLAARRQAQEEIGTFLQEPTIHRIAARFPLGECVAAHETVESGTKRGTVIVLI